MQNQVQFNSFKKALEVIGEQKYGIKNIKKDFLTTIPLGLYLKNEDLTISEEILKWINKKEIEKGITTNELKNNILVFCYDNKQ